MREAQDKFVTYIRTRMFFKQQLRGLEKRPPIYVSQSEIRDKFFPYPSIWRDELAALVNTGALGRIESTTHDNRKIYMYEALKPGAIDISMLIPNNTHFDSVLIQMREYLKQVSLKQGAPSTQFFDLFLKYRDTYLDLFFKVDDFSGRVHSPLTNFHRDYRPNIILNGMVTIGIDVVTMQPLLLGKILKQEIGNNEFSAWLDSGQDVYIMLQQKEGLESRDQGKKRFFEILFSRPNNELAELFGDVPWITWVNQYKRQSEPRNPHTVSKPHSNLAWLLQSTEVHVMRKVWQRLINAGITFVSIHDEVIVKLSEQKEAENIIKGVLGQEFAFFRLNGKSAIPGTQPDLRARIPPQPESVPQIMSLQRETITAPILLIPLPRPPDVKHDFFAADGILYTHWPGLPDIC